MFILNYSAVDIKNKQEYTTIGLRVLFVGEYMDRETFDRILKEEGIEDGNLIDDIWNTRPAGNLDENKLRQAAKKFKENLPGLLVTKALNAALDREYNRD